MPLTFARRLYLYSVGFISPGLRDDARLIPGQLPDEGTGVQTASRSAHYACCRRKLRLAGVAGLA